MIGGRNKQEKDMSNEKFDPGTLCGVSFFDAATERVMRYIYPNAKHWMAGWIITRNPSGEWMTWRRATDDDIKAINKAVVEGHHQEQQHADRHGR